jgi:glutamyl-tRNA synthetase
MRDRVTFPQDFLEQGRFFFEPPRSYDPGVASKKWNADAVRVMSAYRDELRNVQPFNALTAKAALEATAAALSIPTGKILQALRLTMTGTGGGPDLMMIMEIVGKEEVIRRIDHALKTLQVKVS